MVNPIVICDYGLVKASLIPAALLGHPGGCPAGIYDTILWAKGRFVNWEAHLQRFMAGCVFMGIGGVPPNELASEDVFVELISRNGMMEGRARVRLMAFAKGQEFRENGQQIHFLAGCWPVAPVENNPLFKIGISGLRRDSGDLSYQFKLLGRSEVDAELQRAIVRGCADVLFLNQRGEICEGAYSNVWVVKDDKLLTPRTDSPCLPGIVRRRVLEIAAEMGFAPEEAVIDCELLAGADEVFLSSSIRGLQPVSEVEGVWQATENARSSVLLASGLEG